MVVGGVSSCAAQRAATPLIVAYVFPQDSMLHTGDINASSVSRINYAFANIRDGRMVAGFANDAANFAYLDDLRKQNSSLTILVSVGGWLWSGNFSDMALTHKSRDRFIQSAMEFLRRYHLDGLDVDWEYPGQSGAGHRFRKEDKSNFTYLLAELRARFDDEQRKTGKKLYLTIAAGASEDYLDHTEMAEAQKYVDTVNLMAYDYYEPGSGPPTGNHAPLFTDPADPLKVSAEASVKAFEQAGVPAGKLLLGVPFYGHVWGSVPDRNHGLYEPGKVIPNSFAPYNLIESSMLAHGYTRYWDAAASAPYLYNAEQHVFVSYEDPESLAAKCSYILKSKLGGVMFWSYSDDRQGKLLQVVNQSLR